MNSLDFLTDYIQLLPQQDTTLSACFIEYGIFTECNVICPLLYRF